MTEKLKSAALFLLICGSLVQSYMLAYGTPKFDPINPTEYVQTDPIGTKEELVNLLFPDQIILHSGEATHFILYPDDYFYSMILNTVKERSFEGYRAVSSLFDSRLSWADLRNERQGVELHFREGIPLNVLGRMLQIKGDTPLTADVVTGIWIYVKENNEDVGVYYFNDVNDTAYEATSTNMTVKEVERFVGLGQYRTPYHTTTGQYYLPDQPIDSIRYTIPYTQIAAEQMKRSLFVDPAITRNITERDGTEIYTDGKRGLQIKNDRRWMSYTDPPAVPIDSKNDMQENLLAAVQFVNQHGGWNGTFRLSSISQNEQTQGQSFVFRQYYGAFPIMNPPTEHYGTINLVLQKSVVANYDRSLIIPAEEGVKKAEATLAGGKPFDALIKQYSRKSMIRAVFPAYRSTVGEDSIELNPTWVIEYSDGTFDFIAS